MYYNMKKAVFWENNDGSDYSIEYFNLILKRVAHILGGTVIIPILLTECTKKCTVLYTRDPKPKEKAIDQV